MTIFYLRKSGRWSNRLIAMKSRQRIHYSLDETVRIIGRTIKIIILKSSEKKLQQNSPGGSVLIAVQRYLKAQLIDRKAQLIQPKC